MPCAGTSWDGWSTGDPWFSGRCVPGPVDRPAALVLVLLLLAALLVFWIGMKAWSGIGAQTRLIAAAVPLSCWPRKPADLYLVLRAMLAITVMLEGLEVIRHLVQTGSLPYLLSITSRDDFLNNNWGRI